MAGTNDFQLFAVGGSANVLTQSAYAGRSELQNGVQSGQASSQLYNKHARQASIIASMIGQFIANQTGGNAVDDGTTATLVNQFIQAIQISTRIRLTQPTQFYVNPSSGSDNNSGLSLAAPFQTIQGAVNVIYERYDLNSQAVTINLANGTYVSPSGSPVVAVCGLPLGTTQSPPISIVGNVSTPSSVSLQGTNASGVLVTDGAHINLSGVTITSSGTGAFIAGITAIQGGIVTVNGPITTSTSVGPQIMAIGFGSVIISSNYTITGSGGSHFSVLEQGRISVLNVTATCTGNPSFAVFANCESNSTIALSNCSYGGNATGAKYRVVYGGRIISNNSLTFPGGTAGTVDASGSYV